MNIYAMTQGHPLRESVIDFASKCSWAAGQCLAKRMTNDDFGDIDNISY